MFNIWNRIFTKNYKEVLLLWVDFNLVKYLKDGAKDSCMVKIHPVLREDIVIKQTLNKLIDYIRENYDMENLTK